MNFQKCMKRSCKRTCSIFRSLFFIICRIIPLCCIPSLFLGMFVFNWIVIDQLMNFTFDSMLVRQSSDIERKVDCFFNEKMEFFDSLKYDFALGNYYNAEDYEEYERFFFSRFRRDEEISAFYTIFDNRKTFKLHRETPGFLSSQIRIFVNDSYQYRWDRQRSITNETSELTITPKIRKSYDPFAKKWYVNGLSQYPNGFWEGPSFGSSSCTSVECQSPIFIYVRKVVWSNSSRYSVHKLKFRTTSLVNHLKEIYQTENLPNNAMDIVIVDPSWTIVSYRTLEDQIDGTEFRKIWELDNFKDLDQSNLDLALSDETKSIQGYHMVQLGEAMGNWIIVIYLDKGLFLRVMVVRQIISIAVTVVVFFLFLSIICCAIMTICSMKRSNEKKRRDIRTINAISESVSRLDFQHPKIKKLMGRKKCSKSETFLLEIIRNIQSFIPYLPSAFVNHRNDLMPQNKVNRKLSRLGSIYGSIISNRRSSCCSQGNVSNNIGNLSPFSDIISDEGSFGKEASSTGSESSSVSTGSYSSHSSGSRTKSRTSNDSTRRSSSIYKQQQEDKLGLRVRKDCTLLFLKIQSFPTQETFGLMDGNHIQEFFNSYFSLIEVIELKFGIVHPLVSHEITASWNLSKPRMKHKEEAVRCAMAISEYFHNVVFPAWKALFISSTSSKIKQDIILQSISLPKISLVVINFESLLFGAIGGGKIMGLGIMSNTLSSNMVAKYHELNTKCKTEIIICENIFESLSVFLGLFIVDIVNLQKPDNNNQNEENYEDGFQEQRIVCSICDVERDGSSRTGNGEKEEWMYFLKRRRNPFERLNDAWLAFQCGKYQESRVLLRKFIDSSGNRNYKCKEIIGVELSSLRLLEYLDYYEEENTTVQDVAQHHVVVSRRDSACEVIEKEGETDD